MAIGGVRLLLDAMPKIVPTRAAAHGMRNEFASRTLIAMAQLGRSVSNPGIPMRRLAALCLLSVAAVMAAAPAAEAQNRRRGPIVLNVQPRSFLDPGTVVPVGSVDPLMTGQGPTASYLNLPPWTNLRERFGEDRLPDPIVGPFLGARNPVGPVNFVAPDFLR